MADVKLATPNLISAVGVGSNSVPNQEQTKVLNQQKGAVLGAAGKAIDTIGKATGNILPDLKISENLERLGGMLNPKPVYAADGGDLVSALVSKGYNQKDAETAAKGPDAAKLRAEYLGGGNNPPPSNDVTGASAKYKEITGDDPSKDLLDKWTKQGGDLTAIAEQNARLDMANAEAEYNAVMSALGGQKEYVKGSAQTQRERSLAREAELKAEADTQAEKDAARINQEKESYAAGYEQDKSTLAQNWKDISRQTQALQRASGRQDSSFGNFQETKQLMDFNKGLRVLATGNQQALTEFGNAVSDTLDFYRKEKSNIARTVSDELAKVDDWENAQITSIQGQEGVSLAKKFSDINNATKQANNLKMQIQSSINDKVSALDTWLVQTKVNFQNQVAMLAKSKNSAQSVADKISEIKNGVAAGILAVRQGPNKVVEGSTPGTNVQIPTGQVYGNLPGYEKGVEVPYETYSNLMEDRANKLDYTEKLLSGKLPVAVNL